MYPDEPPRSQILAFTNLINCVEGDRVKTVKMEILENRRGKALRITEKAGDRFSAIVIPIHQSPQSDEDLQEGFRQILAAAFG